MNIRHLAYLVALGREKHFRRAAVASHVTQPTLSLAIKQLEEELRVPLIERSNQRFRGFTAEGMRVLEWAQRILSDVESMGQELGEMRQGLTGRLRLGVIPAAMPIVSMITTPLLRRHPFVTVTVLSLTSIEIQRGLDEFDLEAGLTYLDNEPLKNVRATPLYRERYVLLTPENGPFGKKRSVSWAEAASLPLCLLTPNMQNRRIVNRNFQNAGVEPKAVIETDSLTGLSSHVRSGRWSSVVPHTFVALAGELRGMRTVALKEPEASQSVGLVVSARSPQPPLAKALLAVLKPINIAAQIERLRRDT